MDCSVYFKFQSWIYEPGVQGGFRTEAINCELISRQKILNPWDWMQLFKGGKVSVAQSKCCLAESFWLLSLEFGRSWSMKDTEGEDVINGMNRVMGKCGRWELPVQEEEVTRLGKKQLFGDLDQSSFIAVQRWAWPKEMERERDREEEEGELTVCSELIPGFSFPLCFHLCS